LGREGTEWLEVDQHTAEIDGGADERVRGLDAMTHIESGHGGVVEHRPMRAVRVPVAGEDLRNRLLAERFHLIGGLGKNRLTGVFVVFRVVVVCNDRVPGNLSLEIDTWCLKHAHKESPSADFGV
jgi:hypothetical protein